MSSERPILAALSNLDAERLVLGACMIESRAFQQAKVKLDPSDFSLRQHQVVFQVMLRLAKRSVAVDLPAVDAELAAKGELEQAGGSGYLAQLMDGMFKGSNVGHYCDIVREKSRRRRLARLCERIEQEILGTDDTDEIMARAHEQVLALRFDSRNGRPPFVTAKDAAITAFKEIDYQAANPAKLSLCVSGIKALDRLTGGFRPKEQIVICGETSHCKTVLAQQIVRETAKRLSGKQRVLVFSPEMPSSAIMRRQMAAGTGIPTSQLRRSWQLGFDELTQLSSFAHEQDPLFIINDERPLTFERIRAVSELAASQFEIVLLLIDYVQLVHYPGKSDLERDSLLAVDTYTLADHMNAPVILLSQLTKPARSFRRFAPRREGTEEDLLLDQWQCRPTRWDIKGHGALGETPHMVIGTHRHFLHLQEWKDRAELFRNKAEICVLKMRDGGGIGTFEVAFDEELLVLSDPSPSFAESTDFAPSLPKGDRE